MYSISVTLSDVLTQSDKLCHINEADIIEKLVIDSRQACVGCWFICLQGDSFDGHDFIDEVLLKKPAGIIFSKDIANLTGLQVQDTTEFLGRLAHRWRKKMSARVIAITGSNGKTSTKEVLYAMLASIYTGAVNKTEKNFNNHFGVPYTLLSLTEKTKYLVIELGTSSKGEIAYLSKIAEPDFAIITLIAEAHIEFFKTIVAIADEKSDILVGMHKNDQLAVDEKITYFNIIREKSRQRSIQLLVKSKIKPLSSGVGGHQFSYNNEDFHFPYIGEHQLKNLDLAVRVVEQIIKKEDMPRALKALANLQASKGRLQKRIIATTTIWDDSYNANLSSMKAAIQFMNKNFTDFILLLGEMAELGENSLEQHFSLFELAQKSKAKKIVFYIKDKELLENLFEKNTNRERIFIAGFAEKDMQTSFLFIQEFLKDNNVLVKGSRSIQTERMIDLITLKLK